MKSSSPSRKISVRNPSHLGSKSHPSPGGRSLTRLASIGRTGGVTGRSMANVIPCEPVEDPMTIRLALPLALIVAAGCADKLTGPAAQSAAREYQSKSIAASRTPIIFVDGKEIPADSLRRFPVEDIESVEV